MQWFPGPVPDASLSSFPALSGERSAASPRGRWKLAVAAVIAVLFLAVVSQTVTLSKRAALESLRERSEHSLSLFIANLRKELEKYEFLPELVGTNHSLAELLKAPDDEARTDRINRYLEQTSRITHASDIYLMDDTGLTLAASNWDTDRPFVGRNFAYRPYFQAAMQGELGRYFALGATSNRRGYYFAYPVRDDDDAILGAVVVKVSLESVERAWAGGFDEYLVTDPDGVVFISTQPDWKFRTLSPLPEPAYRRIQASRRYSDASVAPMPISGFEPAGSDAAVITLQAARPQASSGDQRPAPVDYLLLGQSMPEAGWTVHILSRLDPVRSQVFKASVLGAFVFALLVVSAVLWRQRRQVVAERVRHAQAARDVLEANEARVRVIIDSTRAGLITTDSGGHIEFFNPTAEDLFGYRAEEMTGRCFASLLTDRAGDGCLGPLAALVAGDASSKDPGTAEVLARNKGGKPFPVELSCARVSLRDGLKYIATFHDISERKEHEQALQRAHDDLEARVKARTRDLTQSNERLSREIEERRRAEQTLRQTQDELVQAAKLAGLGQMSAGIGHELNQPLAAIRSYADNARDLLDRHRAGDARWNLEQVSELTARMAEIITQLKSFARKSSGQAVPVSVAAVLDGAIKLLGSRGRQGGADLRISLPEEDLLVWADSVRLQQVFVNLLTNAIQAMEQSAPRILVVSATAAREHVTITFKDSGPGIPDENLSEIFDPFFTTKEAGQGLGLGLSISYHIIEQLGGVLRASNGAVGGAVFTLVLRRAPADDGE